MMNQVRRHLYSVAGRRGLELEKAPDFPVNKTNLFQDPRWAPFIMKTEVDRSLIDRIVELTIVNYYFSGM